MQSTQQASPAGSGRVSWNRLVLATLVAVVLAAGANVAVYLVAAAAGAMPQDVDVNGWGPIGLTMVVFASTFGAVAGGGVYALIVRFSRRPVRVFYIVALVALALSFIGPLTIQNVPAAMIATLLLMHAVAAVVVVGSLTTLAHGR